MQTASTAIPPFVPHKTSLHLLIPHGLQKACSLRPAGGRLLV